MKQQIISVIGLGFVGLPTACTLANCKDKKTKNIFKVNGIDKNITDKITIVEEAKTYNLTT